MLTRVAWAFYSDMVVMVFGDTSRNVDEAKVRVFFFCLLLTGLKYINNNNDKKKKV